MPSARALRPDHVDERPPHLQQRLHLQFGFRNVRAPLLPEPRSNLLEIDFVFSFPFLLHSSSECHQRLACQFISCYDKDTVRPGISNIDYPKYSSSVRVTDRDGSSWSPDDPHPDLPKPVQPRPRRHCDCKCEEDRWLDRGGTGSSHPQNKSPTQTRQAAIRQNARRHNAL